MYINNMLYVIRGSDTQVATIKEEYLASMLGLSNIDLQLTHGRKNFKGSYTMMTVKMGDRDNWHKYPELFKSDHSMSILIGMYVLFKTPDLFFNTFHKTLDKECQNINPTSYFKAGNTLKIYKDHPIFNKTLNKVIFKLKNAYVFSNKSINILELFKSTMNLLDKLAINMSLFKKEKSSINRKICEIIILLQVENLKFLLDLCNTIVAKNNTEMQSIQSAKQMIQDMITSGSNAKDSTSMEVYVNKYVSKIHKVHSLTKSSFNSANATNTLKSEDIKKFDAENKSEGSNKVIAMVMGAAVAVVVVNAKKKDKVADAAKNKNKNKIK